MAGREHRRQVPCVSPSKPPPAKHLLCALWGGGSQAERASPDSSRGCHVFLGARGGTVETHLVNARLRGVCQVSGNGHFPACQQQFLLHPSCQQEWDLWREWLQSIHSFIHSFVPSFILLRHAEPDLPSWGIQSKSSPAGTAGPLHVVELRGIVRAATECQADQDHSHGEAPEGTLIQENGPRVDEGRNTQKFMFFLFIIWCFF